MNIRYQYHYVTGLLKRYGFRGLVFKTLERSKSPMLSYSSCYMRYMPTEEVLNTQRNTPLLYAPLVSIVVPTYETPKAYLMELLESVIAQTYPNWQLCLADGSRSDCVEQVVCEYAAADKRVCYKRLKENGGISENTNGGFAMAKGEYIALMDHDDLLTPNALYEMVQCLNTSYTKEERKLAMIYSDEDKMNGDATVYSRPHFKPDFNLEFLRHNNYFCHFLMFSSGLLEKAGGLQKEYDGAQDYDFVLRCVDAGAIVRHVPRILYHWRIHEGSTAGNSTDKAYAFDNGCRAIEAHLSRCQEPGKARLTTNLGVYDIEYALQGEYQITVAAEKAETLESIRAYYGKYYKEEDYQLKIEYRLIESLEMQAIEKYQGDYILYLRRDMKVKPKDLIETLLRTCQHKKNAVVGAKLLTPKRRIASCGIIYDKEGNLIPACGGLPAEYKGYFLHACIPKKVSVISFGLVMLRKDALLGIKGLAQNLRGIYRDADCCFALEEAGYDVIVTPKITAVQYRKEHKDEEMQKIFFEKWKKKLLGFDACYNRNLSTQPEHTYAMKE